MRWIFGGCFFSIFIRFFPYHVFVSMMYRNTNWRRHILTEHTTERVLAYRTVSTRTYWNEWQIWYSKRVFWMRAHASGWSAPIVTRAHGKRAPNQAVFKLNYPSFGRTRKGVNILTPRSRVFLWSYQGPPIRVE